MSPSIAPSRAEYDPVRAPLEADTPHERTGSLILDAPEGAQARVICWTGRTAWLDMVAADLDTDHGQAVRRHHKPSRTVVLAVAADDAAHADSRTGRNVATSWDRTARRIGCSRDTVRRAQRVLRDLGWTVEVARGRHLTRLERMRASLAGHRQHRAASVRCLTIPTRCHHLIQHTQAPEQTALHPHPAGVRKSLPSPSSSTARAARKRAAGTTIRRSQTRQEPVTLDMQRLTARLVQRLPWLDTGKHLNSLARALSRVGVTAEWTAQDLMTALNERNEAHGVLSLPVASQRNPRALLIHQLRQALDGRTPPAVARAQAHEAARAEARQTRQRLARDAAIREANAVARAADPRPFRQRWAETIAAAQAEARTEHQTA